MSDIRVRSSLDSSAWREGHERPREWGFLVRQLLPLALKDCASFCQVLVCNKYPLAPFCIDDGLMWIPTRGWIRRYECRLVALIKSYASNLDSPCAGSSQK